MHHIVIHHLITHIGEDASPGFLTAVEGKEMVHLPNFYPRTNLNQIFVIMVLTAQLTAVKMDFSNSRTYITLIVYNL